MNLTSFNLHAGIRQEEHAGGYCKTVPFKVTDIKYDNSNILAPITSATVPGLLAGVLSSGVPVVNHTGECIEYAGAEGGNDYGYLVWEIPQDYDEDSDAFVLSGWVWKHDTTGSATDNTDAAIVAELYTSETDSETADTLVGTVPGSNLAYHTIQAQSATADWRRFVLDFSRNIPGSNNRRNALTRGDKVIIRLDLNEDIGTNLAALIRNLAINYRASVGVFNKDARQEFGNA